MRHVGVDLTSQAGEWAIRPGGLWREGSFGIHSVEGSRVVEVMMRIIAMCKQQHRNVLDYLIAACEAARRGCPSLLPTPAAFELFLHPAAWLDDIDHCLCFPNDHVNDCRIFTVRSRPNPSCEVLL